MLRDPNALLDNVRAELLDRERTHVAGKLSDDSVAEAVVIQVEDILHHVVSVGVLNERQCIVSDLIDELDTLRLRSVIHTALEDTASVAMSGDLDTVGSNSVVDELVVLGLELVKALLNNVVAVKILDQNDDVQAQSDNDRVNLEPQNKSVRSSPTIPESAKL